MLKTRVGDIWDKEIEKNDEKRKIIETEWECGIKCGINDSRYVEKFKAVSVFYYIKSK